MSEREKQVGYPVEPTRNKFHICYTSVVVSFAAVVHDDLCHNSPLLGHEENCHVSGSPFLNSCLYFFKLSRVVYFHSFCY